MTDEALKNLIIIEMSQGNPGAISVLTKLAITPEAIILLGVFGILGSDIWVLYKYCCGQDIEKLVAQLLANDESVLKLAIENRTIL